MRFLLSCALLAGLAFSTAASASPTELFGVWRNPKGSVHLEIRPCAEVACGYVVWASAEAKADVRRGSGKELVGLQLLRDFTPSKSGWRGKVYVPDLNITLGGTARAIDVDHLEARGCLVTGVICKKQIWTRVTEQAAVR